MWAKTRCIVPVFAWGGEKRTRLLQKSGPGQADALQFMTLQAAAFSFLQFNVSVVNTSLKGSMPLSFAVLEQEKRKEENCFLPSQPAVHGHQLSVSHS